MTDALSFPGWSYRGDRRALFRASVGWTAWIESLPDWTIPKSSLLLDYPLLLRLLARAIGYRLTPLGFLLGCLFAGASTWDVSDTCAVGVLVFTDVEP